VSTQRHTTRPPPRAVAYPGASLRPRWSAASG